VDEIRVLPLNPVFLHIFPARFLVRRTSEECLNPADLDQVISPLGKFHQGRGGMPSPVEIKPPADRKASRRFAKKDLLHQQHLAGPFDGVGHAALIMGREAGVFARQNATLIRDELAEQVDVLEIQRILGEVNFRLRTGCAGFGGATLPAAAVRLFRIGLAGHNYLISL